MSMSQYIINTDMYTFILYHILSMSIYIMSIPTKNCSSLFQSPETWRPLGTPGCSGSSPQVGTRPHLLPGRPISRPWRSRCCSTRRRSAPASRRGSHDDRPGRGPPAPATTQSAGSRGPHGLSISTKATRELWPDPLKGSVAAGESEGFENKKQVLS